MIHIVQSGETIQRISALIYGDWTLWPLIRDLNSNLNPVYGFGWENELVEGMRLKIDTQIRVSPVEHTVIESDTYENLSLEYYKTEHFSERIRLENDYKILRYEVGNKVRIPALLDRKKFEMAKRRWA